VQTDAKKDFQTDAHKERNLSGMSRELKLGFTGKSGIWDSQEAKVVFGIYICDAA
jgi:hypothetical protein